MGQMRAGFAEFHTAQPDISDQEIAADQRIEPNAARDQISTADREILRSCIRAQKSLDLFGFDQGQILPGFIVAAKVTIPFDAQTGNHDHLFAFDWRHPLRRADE